MAPSKNDERAGSDPDSPTTYPITVDYDRTLAEMVTAGRYDGYVDPGITADRFPIEGSGMAEFEGVLVHPNRYTTTEEVESEIAKCGLRPARLEELLAFGETYPDVHQKFPIIGLGSSWVDPKHRSVPCLWGGETLRPLGKRHLGLSWGDPGGRILDPNCNWKRPEDHSDRQWLPDCRFLAVRK